MEHGTSQRETEKWGGEKEKLLLHNYNKNNIWGGE